MQLGTGVACCIGVLLCGCTQHSDGAKTVAGAAVVVSESPYVTRVEQWRATRIADLRSPDGWLSYTGSGRLRPGVYRVGNAADNDIVTPSGPSHLGTLELGGEQVRFTAMPDAKVSLGGKPVGQVTLNPEQADRRGDRLAVGNAQFYVVRTGPVFGWRFRDPDAPARTAFKGIDYFPVDWRWRIEAEWHPYTSPRQVTLLTSIGTPVEAQVPGEAVFYRDGRRYRLQPVLHSDGVPGLFFLFTDRTSGKESYGGARYLFTDAPHGGKVVLDFNEAENPPCALTPHVVCPIAPPENRLDLTVAAGEKTYVAAH